MIDRWQWPWMLVLLVLVPIVLLASRDRAQSGVMYTQNDLLAAGRRSWRVRFAWLPAFLRAVSIALIVVALARPQQFEGHTRTTIEGVAIQLVIDRSSSMEQPMRWGSQMSTRIEVTRAMAKEFVQGPDSTSERDRGRQGDMIGLVGFAGFADTLCPLVRSHAALITMIDQIETASIRGEDGTAIGSALQLAAARLKNAEAEIARNTARSDQAPDFVIKSKVVILLTDGANNRGISPIDAAHLAAEWGIRVYTIGIGDTSSDNALRSLFTPMEVDRDLLQRIASITGGRYFSAADAEAMRQVYNQIDELERSKVEIEEFTDYIELYRPLAIAAFAAILLESLLRTLVLRRTT
ncbi:MAG: VWA domain-containing protein [Phycisphaeraceae bacterium]|nr:VWA domain-containing protein [Phycisphaeraceae bacterium]MCW5763053.1 VWA domain-containing protein [Phycisphaeraceae bacterium]